ncbi:MAG: T9SS type B sorting domain-containing protein, partial [Flavobacteriaceae bacterium]|nr:T9SS type B sorting domain-containing protein [Flavobacteriaceae bacterium]
YEITELLLEVLLILELGLPESVSVCTDSNGSPQVADPVLDTGLSPINYSFEWSLDGNVIPTETGPSIVASVGGLYTVLVTDNNTGCFNSDSTNVIESSPPVLTAQVISRPFADNNIIEATATGFGDYEYSLNGGPFQSSGRFENVPPGANDIVARDINGCGTDAVSVVVLNYPRFFTPNGDGVNDIWNIGGLPAGSAAVVYIYDRYGKLLVQFNPRRNSWDGTFNGYTMPATDYWFTIDFNNPSNGNRETFQAHFSLRR